MPHRQFSLSYRPNLQALASGVSKGGLSAPWLLLAQLQLQNADRAAAETAASARLDLQKSVSDETISRPPKLLVGSLANLFIITVA